MNTVKIGMIGLGDHAMQSHAEYLAHDPRVEIIAGCDPSTAKLEEFRATLGNAVRLFTNESELFTSDIDAVIIASPDRFHADSSLAAVEAGKHVLVEKPLAHSLETLAKLKSMIDIAREKMLVLTSCHPRRFDKPYVWLKNQLVHFVEQFGQVMDVHLDFSYHEPTKTGLHTGLLMDHVNHEVDFINYLLGPSDFDALKQHDDQTRYHATGKREDGIVFNFSGTRMLKEYTYPESVTIRFARGEVRLNTKTGAVHIFDHETSSVSQEQCEGTDYEHRFKGVNGNFVSAILDEEQNYLTSQDLITNTEMGIYLTEKGTYSKKSDR